MVALLEGLEDTRGGVFGGITLGLDVASAPLIARRRPWPLGAGIVWPCFDVRALDQMGAVVTIAAPGS